MSWTCQLLNIIGIKPVTYNPLKDGYLAGETLLVDDQQREYSLKELPIGTMFYLPKDADMTDWPWYLAEPNDLSDYYHQNNSHRQPLYVILPKHNLFIVDGKCWSNGIKYGGWTVTGEAPNITVQPSINMQGHYHGWIQNGVVSDDCEGRQF